MRNQVLENLKDLWDLSTSLSSRLLEGLEHNPRDMGSSIVPGKDTWGCAASKGILFWSPSLAKCLLFGNFSRF